MRKHMDTLMDEVNPRGLALIIQVLEFVDKFHEYLVTLNKFFARDTMPLEKAHTRDQLTIV